MRLGQLLLRAGCVIVALSSVGFGRAQAAENVSLKVSLSQEQLGKPTTISLGLKISSSTGSPVALTSVGLLLPSEMGIATSGLGLENCAPSMLEELGPNGCPMNSVMGRGAATAEVPISSDPVSERARVEIFSAPVIDGHLGLLVYAEGVSPIFAQLVFGGAVLPARSPFGENVETDLPLVPSVPGAPDVAITAFQARLGSAPGYNHFVYRKRMHGQELPYTPRGLILPPSCPRGGFPFKAELGFQDETVAVAKTTVACPRRKDERQPRGRA